MTKVVNVFRLPKGHENHRRLFLGPRCESLAVTHYFKSSFFVQKVDFDKSTHSNH